jgi:hypothetical protein
LGHSLLICWADLLRPCYKRVTRTDVDEPHSKVAMHHTRRIPRGYKTFNPLLKKKATDQLFTFSEVHEHKDWGVEGSSGSSVQHPPQVSAISSADCHTQVHQHHVLLP